MLDALHVYYAENYAGIIDTSLEPTLALFHQSKIYILWLAKITLEQ